MGYTKKYIITGAPGTGKTTLIEALKAKGYSCMDEISRKVIQKEQQNGSDGMPWLNLGRFVKLVYDQTKHDLNNNQTSAFCDRGLPDMIAYLKHKELEVPEWLVQFPFANHYHPQVFLAPIWEDIYITDAQRPTTFDVAKELEAELLSTYRSLGFRILKIPQNTPSDRAHFVSTNIANIGNPNNA